MRHPIVIQLDRLWRIFGTGFSFVVFGLGGILLALSWLPIVYLSPVSIARKQRLSRLGLHYVFRVYVRMMSSMRLLTTTTTGVERIPPHGAIVVANHPCLLDVVFLIAQIPNANCIVKAGLFSNPFTWPTVKAAGYIRSGDEALLDTASDSLERGDTLLIFPEGTRTTPGKASKYQRGAAHLALLTGKPICPARITVSPPTLLKGQPWYDVPERAFDLAIDFLPPIDAASTSAGTRSLAARSLTTRIEHCLANATSTTARSGVVSSLVSGHNGRPLVRSQNEQVEHDNRHESLR